MKVRHVAMLALLTSISTACKKQMKDKLVTPSKSTTTQSAQKKQTKPTTLLPQIVADSFSETVTNRLKEVGGMDPIKTHALIVKIKKALNQGDAKTFASLLTYPQTVCLNDRLVTIENATELEEAFPTLISIKFRKGIIQESLKDMFVNWKGAFLYNGSIWFNDRKINSLYTSSPKNKNTKIQFYKKNGRESIMPSKGHRLQCLLKTLKLPYKVSKYDDSQFNPMKDQGYGEILQLYVADLNNDGRRDYIIIEIGQGSMHSSAVRKVYTIKNSKRIELPYFKYLSKSQNFEEWNDFSVALSTPFIYKKNGIVYHGFDNEAYYVWKGKSVTKLKK